MPQHSQVCKTCKRRKPIASFHKRGSGYIRIVCKVCHNRQQKLRNALRTPAQLTAAKLAYKKWRKKNGERQNNKRMTAYYADDALRARVLTQSQQYYNKYKPIVIARQKRSRDKLKREVMAAYGNKCSCCPEIELNLLTIEHINKDGKQHRASVSSVYRDLRKRGFPKKGFTILCFNCNIGRALFGVCPHQRRKSK